MTHPPSLVPISISFWRSAILTVCTVYQVISRNMETYELQKIIIFYAQNCIKGSNQTKIGLNKLGTLKTWMYHYKKTMNFHKKSYFLSILDQKRQYSLNIIQPLCVTFGYFWSFFIFPRYFLDLRRARSIEWLE